MSVCTRVKDKVREERNGGDIGNMSNTQRKKLEHWDKSEGHETSGAARI